MRRRSERKKSAEALSPPPVVKRPGRRSHRTTSQVETRKANKTEEAKINNDVVSNDTKQQSSSNSEKLNDTESKSSRRSASPPVEETMSPKNPPELETIPEVSVDEKTEESSSKNACVDDIKAVSPSEEKSPQVEKAPEEPANTEEAKESSEETTPEIKVNDTEDKANGVPAEEEDTNSSKEQTSTSIEESKSDETEKTKTESEAETVQKQQSPPKQDEHLSPEKTPENPPPAVEHRKTFNRTRERRNQVVTKPKDETENDENEEVHNKSQKNLTSFSTPSNDKTQSTRKRRWMSKRTTDSSSQILAISTDSLKNLISDVHPVPLCDVKLESSSEVEEVESEREDGEASPTPYKSRTEKSSIFDRERKTSKSFDQPLQRKISVVSDGYESAQPVPTRNDASCVLYITNLVRPFTILQLKGLLARTGKIVENRFWIDKIKSKCFVQYETEDEAVETRHALHGVRWPTSNPKCLNVDFGTEADMEKAMESTQDSGPLFGQDTGRENRIVGTGWDRDRFEFDEKKVQVGRPVREWDVGKKEELESEAERTREREKQRVGERGGDRVPHNERIEKDNNIRGKERGERDRDRKRRSAEFEHRRSLSTSPARKTKKKNNEPPLRLLDDLFRKTKTTPCIYWLPLTPEQIAEKEAFRLRRIAEHQERVKQRELEKEKEREKERDRERERDKDRRRERERSIGHRRTSSRDRRRY